MGEMKKSFSAEFKARVAMEVLKEEKTLAELASEFGGHPNLISCWKETLKELCHRSVQQWEKRLKTGQKSHKRVGDL